MRLLYTVGSPFARMVRIALLETGLDSRVTKHELTRAQLYSADSEVLVLSPIGRVPALKLDDGTVLTESLLILDYIDAQVREATLLPRDGSDGWRTLAEMGQAIGLLEGITTWLRALLLPEAERPETVIARESLRVNRAADSLENAVASGAYTGQLNRAHIVLGTALGMVETRLPAWQWRDRRPGLSQWYDAIADRPSFRATEPPAL